MIDNWSVLDRMDHAERETPFCICGQPMSPVARPDGIWLECASLPEPDGGRLARLLAALAAGGHTRQLVVELAEVAA